MPFQSLGVYSPGTSNNVNDASYYQNTMNLVVANEKKQILKVLYNDYVLISRNSF